MKDRTFAKRVRATLFNEQRHGVHCRPRLLQCCPLEIKESGQRIVDVQYTMKEHASRQVMFRGKSRYSMHKASEFQACSEGQQIEHVCVSKFITSVRNDKS